MEKTTLTLLSAWPDLPSTAGQGHLLAFSAPTSPILGFQSGTVTTIGAQTAPKQG